MTITGMNVAEIRNLAGQLQRRAESVERSTREVQRLVDLSRTNWAGDDIRQFEARWNGGTHATAQRISGDLRQLAEIARRNADAQERASAELDGGFGGGGGGLLPGSWPALPLWIDKGMDWLGDRVEDGISWTQQAGMWVENKVIDAGTWLNNSVEDVGNWFEDRGNDVANFVQPRIDAVSDGWNTFQDALGAFGTAIDSSDGHPPQLSEVLAGGVLVLGTGFGMAANAVAGRDLGIFSPGIAGAGQPTPMEGATPVTDFNSLTNATMSAYENGVRVDTIVGADGVTRYIVSVPGTEADIGSLSGWADNSNARNWSSNLWAIAQGADSTNAQAVQAAIENAGVPDGASIMLAGHSQGGIIATNLAADSNFAARYQVDGVVTYGSPVETADLTADSAPVLAFGHGNTIGQGPFGLPTIEQIGDPVHQLDMNGIPLIPGTNDKQGNITEIGLPPVGDNWFDMRANHEQAGYINDVANLSPQNQAAVNQYLQNNNLGVYLNGTTTSTVTVETKG